MPRKKTTGDTRVPGIERADSARDGGDAIPIAELPAFVQSWKVPNEWLSRLGLDRERLRLLLRNPRVSPRALISKRKLVVGMFEQLIDRHRWQLHELEARQQNAPTAERARFIAHVRPALNILVIWRDFAKQAPPEAESAS